MCKEDVRIGRKLATRTVFVDPTVANPGLALRANPSRLSAVLAVRPGVLTTGDVSTIIGLPDRNGVQPLAGVSSQVPSVVLTLEGYGTALLGELWVETNNGFFAGAWVTETYLTEDLKDV